MQSSVIRRRLSLRHQGAENHAGHDRHEQAEAGRRHPGDEHRQDVPAPAAHAVLEELPATDRACRQRPVQRPAVEPQLLGHGLVHSPRLIRRSRVVEIVAAPVPDQGDRRIAALEVADQRPIVALPPRSDQTNGANARVRGLGDRVDRVDARPRSRRCRRLADLDAHRLAHARRRRERGLLPDPEAAHHPSFEDRAEHPGRLGDHLGVALLAGGHPGGLFLLHAGDAQRGQRHGLGVDRRERRPHLAALEHIAGPLDEDP